MNKYPILSKKTREKIGEMIVGTGSEIKAVYNSIRRHYVQHNLTFSHDKRAGFRAGKIYALTKMKHENFIRVVDASSIMKMMGLV